MSTPLPHDASPDKSLGFVIQPDDSKLEALAEFAAGAGHEINNPLATIIGRAQLLLKNESDPERRQMLMSIGAQAYRIRDMIGDTMLFGRPPLPELTDLHLRDLINTVVTKQSLDFDKDRCTVQAEIPDSLHIRADRIQFSIVLTELIRNSRRALQPQGGTIRVTATMESSQAVICVIDQGSGFTEQERQHAFDPFFSGRQAGRGLGFGLPKCWRIIQQHGGKIEIQSTPNDLTTVRIEWPAALS